LKLQQQKANNERQENGRDNAHHPRWKKTAEHIDRRRSAAPGTEKANQCQQWFP
jgi:hypothetical protein